LSDTLFFFFLGNFLVVNFVQFLFPPSIVTCTNPSSVPAYVHFHLTVADSAIVVTRPYLSVEPFCNSIYAPYHLSPLVYLCLSPLKGFRAYYCPRIPLVTATFVRCKYKRFLMIMPEMSWRIPVPPVMVVRRKLCISALFLKKFRCSYRTRQGLALRFSINYIREPV